MENSQIRGVVHAEELYTLEELKRRLGIGDGALRVARRSGLVVRYAHRLGYVYGRDWIDYILSRSPSGNAEDAA